MAEFHPEQILTIRKNGSGTVTISVPPDRVREMGEALLVLITDAKSDRAKSKILIDLAVASAQELLRDDPDLYKYLKDVLEELKPVSTE